NDTIAFQDAPGSGLESIDSDFSDIVTFLDPTASLTINAGDGNDSVAVNSLDAAYNATTTILGGAGTDSITQFANLNLGSMQSTGDLLYQAETIALNGNLHSPGTATYDTGNSVSSVGVSQSAGATITADMLLLL